jgi:hypothetical protein
MAVLSAQAGAQGVGTSGEIDGTVLDPSGAAVPNAIVEIQNPVSGFTRSTTTNNYGAFSFTNVPTTSLTATGTIGFHF